MPNKEPAPSAYNYINKGKAYMSFIGMLANILLINPQCTCRITVVICLSVSVSLIGGNTDLQHFKRTDTNGQHDNFKN